jgi:protein-disulfide isomerase
MPLLLNRILLVLAFAGLFVSGVLSLSKALNVVVPCGVQNTCQVVTSHPSAFWGPIPVAYVGFFGYLMLAGLAVAISSLGAARARHLVVAGYVVSAAGAAISAYLQYQAFFVIHAACWWCLASAVLMLATLIVYAILAQHLEGSGEPTPAVAGDFGLVSVLAVLVVGGLGYQAFAMKSDSTKVAKVERPAHSQKLVPEHAQFFGEVDAPITIVEFADLICPACRQASPEVKKAVELSDGTFRLVFRHMPLYEKDGHQMALPAALAAEIAAEQNRYWAFLEAFFGTEKPAQTLEDLLAVAQQVGLDRDEVSRRIADSDDPIYGRVLSDLAAAAELGVQLTPTFFVIYPDGETLAATANSIGGLLTSPKTRRIYEERTRG